MESMICCSPAIRAPNNDEVMRGRGPASNGPLNSALIRCLHAIAAPSCDPLAICCSIMAPPIQAAPRHFPARRSWGETAGANSLLSPNILCLSKAQATDDRCTWGTCRSPSRPTWGSSASQADRLIGMGRIRGNQDVHGYCRNHLA